MKRISAIFICIVLTVCTAGGAFAENGLPSKQWFAENFHEAVEVLAALAADGDYLESINLPEHLLGLIAPAEAYSAEPAYILYSLSGDEAADALCRLSGIAESTPAVRDDAEGLFLNMLLSGLLQWFPLEWLAAVNAVTISEYVKQENAIAPAIAFFEPADGCSGDIIALCCSWKNGVAGGTLRLMPADILPMLMDDDSVLNDDLRELGLGISTEESAAQHEYPSQYGEWAAEKALALTEKMIQNASDPAYLSLFTENQEILDACSHIGNASAENMAVEDIKFLAADSIAAEYGFDIPEDMLGYIKPNLAGLSAQMEINVYGEFLVAASSVMTVSDVYIEQVDFDICNVTVSTAGRFDISVSFANMGDGIVVATARPVPVPE